MKKDDNKKFLKNLFGFLDSDSGESLEELTDELKEEGVNFESAEAKLKETFSKLIQKRKSEAREEDRKKMIAAQTNFRQFRNEQKIPKGKNSKIEEINRIISEHPGLKRASRNYESDSDEDLERMLVELRFLIKQNKSND